MTGLKKEEVLLLRPAKREKNEGHEFQDHGAWVEVWGVAPVPTFNVPERADSDLQTIVHQRRGHHDSRGSRFTLD